MELTVRELREQQEKQYLNPHAFFSSETRGRSVFEKPCELRTDFARDRDRIIHCKSFRRLKHKTQVFLSPEGDHYRTRLTHTLEVSQIARTIARALGLNEDLTEAIAMGHDLGHTPFGHAGERKLNEICSQGFNHAMQSLRVVEVLEKGHKGLNLTYEVCNGIVNHSGRDVACTLEGQIVKFADRIAYINHDIDDAVRGGILSETDIPKKLTDVLGNSHSKRIDTLIKGVISASSDYKEITLGNEIKEAADKLREFMFESVYFNSAAKSEENKAENVVEMLFEYYLKNIEALPPDHLDYIEADGKERAVIDFVAGMSDRYAIAMFERFFVPQTWNL